MVTPFHHDRIDLGALQSLARDLGAEGVAGNLAGAVLFGSTGEGHLLSIAERRDAANAVRDAAPSLPLIFGAGGIDTRDVARDLRALDALQPDAWLIPPPCYLQPSEAGIHWHYATLSDASDRPIVIYDVPGRTGVRLSAGTVESLCETTSCAAIKACDAALRGDLLAQGRIPVFCGDDTAFLAHAAAGGQGAISASAHVRPDLFAAILRLAPTDAVPLAHELFNAVLPLIHALFQEPNPAPLKALLAQAGRIHDELRRPLTPASRTLARQVRALAAALPSRDRVQHMERQHGVPTMTCL
ncbi:dihydrodipicolinate synthase family protein [Pigmentiphaga litoralis]|uniref:dihydrodipicolinate synthase family protein n=1 Tax=Pigmentiphaga litoralis TaxID=516702 RepID=UPI003B4360EC